VPPGVRQRSGRAAAAVLALLLALAPLAGHAATAAPAPAAAPPPKVQEMLNLLADPGVQQWIEQHGKPAATPPAELASEATDSLSAYGAERMATVHEHVMAVVTALPTVPSEVMKAGRTLTQSFMEHGLIRIFLLIAGFVILGLGAELLYRRVTAGIRAWIVTMSLDTVRQRVSAIGIRSLYGAGMLLAFAIGSIGAFLAFDWPPLLREFVLAYLTAFLALRWALVLTRFLLAPHGERFRILPMTTTAAIFWHRRLALGVGWFAFGRVSLSLLHGLGMSFAAREVIAYGLGIGLVAIALEAVWRRPVAAAPDAGRRRHHAGEWLLSAYAVLLWLLWVMGAMPAFWLAVVAVGLPASIRAARRATDHVLRPPGTAEATESVPDVVAAAVARALRGLLIAAAAVLLIWAWDLNLTALARGDTMMSLARGVLHAVVILLLADFAWHVARTVIDRRLAATGGAGLADTEEQRRSARLRTLLPILRNMILIVLLVMAVLMALSALGIEVGPLIAGAGVVGVAVGFGAQTLVRDIISGIFYVLDDAFRVGEYIQTGSYKGTVESFSLRSVKLRHHRGPLYTVPFGVLGAVQNMSRDWVIDKLSVGVTYDTDLDKVKKLVKLVGKELLADPELAPNIIETLKLQGVEEFGDFAIQMRMKMKTKPGEQFIVRRRAYALIKKHFDANGIKFAYPTVQIAGGELTDAATQAAVAQQGLELVRPSAPPAA